jgi:hypothetical protein
MRAAAGDFESEPRIEFQRSLIRSANLEECFFSFERVAPLERFAEKRGAGSLAAGFGTHCEIQNFEVLQNSPRDEEACELETFFRDPACLISQAPRTGDLGALFFVTRDAIVVPGRPLRDFRAKILDFENRSDIRMFEGADFQGAFQ